VPVWYGVSHRCDLPHARLRRGILTEVTSALSSAIVSRLRGGLAPLLVFLGASLVYLPTAATTSLHADVASSALGGWRIATTGSPSLDGVDLDEFPLHFGIPLWTGEAANGHTVVLRSPGAIAATVPGYWLSNDGTDISTFGIAPQARTAALLAAATVALIFAAVRRVGTRQAAVVSLALAFTTPMWSVDADALWPHALTTLGIAGMAWGASRDKWWLVGVFGGLALWGRLHAAIIVALLGLAVALWRRRPGIALQAGVPSALMLGLAMVWSRWMYGNWSPSGGYDAGAIASAATSAGGNGSGVGIVNQLGLWFALDRGILVWTPAILLMLPALVVGWRRMPDWPRVLIVGGLIYTVIQGRLNPFHGGDGFWGYRLGLEFLLCATPALAYSTRSLTRWVRLALPVVLSVQFAAVSIGALTYAVYLTTDQMWDHNSFVEALRARPATWMWLVLCLTAGLVWSWREARRQPSGTVAPVAGSRV